MFNKKSSFEYELHVLIHMRGLETANFTVLYLGSARNLQGPKENVVAQTLFVNSYFNRAPMFL